MAMKNQYKGVASHRSFPGGIICRVFWLESFICAKISGKKHRFLPPEIHVGRKTAASIVGASHDGV